MRGLFDRFLGGMQNTSPPLNSHKKSTSLQILDMDSWNKGLPALKSFFSSKPAPNCPSFKPLEANDPILQEFGLLDRVYGLFAIQPDCLDLHRQTNEFKLELLRKLKEKTQKSDKERALEIQEQMNAFSARESQRNRQGHRERGGLGNTPLHKVSSPTHRLTDDQMTFLMPKSTPQSSLDIIAVADTGNPALRFPIVEGIRTSSLANPNIQHFMFAIGPGHWRLCLVTKPQKGSELYQVTLFDSFGPMSAASVQNFVLKILTDAGIDETQINIHCQAPLLRQTDGFSCGDHVLAQAHILAKELDPNQCQYNQGFISAYQQDIPKDNGKLRDATRTMSATLAKESVVPYPTRRFVAPPPVPKQQTSGWGDGPPVSLPLAEVSSSPMTQLYKSNVDTLFSKKSTILDAAACIRERVAFNGLKGTMNPATAQESPVNMADSEYAKSILSRIQAGEFIKDEIVGISDEEYATLLQAAEFRPGSRC